MTKSIPIVSIGAIISALTLVLSLPIFGVEVRTISCPRFLLGASCMIIGCTLGAHLTLVAYWQHARKDAERAEHQRTVEAAGHLSKLLLAIDNQEKQQTILSSLPGLLFDETREALAILKGDLEGPRIHHAWHTFDRQ